MTPAGRLTMLTIPSDECGPQKKKRKEQAGIPAGEELDWGAENMMGWRIAPLIRAGFIAAAATLV
jgi:hypothetical protein